MAVSPIVKRLLDIERAQLGTQERPHGSNQVKYNTAFYRRPVRNEGHTNYAWCVVFQWWCFQRAGIPTSIFPKSAGVFAVRDWYDRKNRFNHTPRVGSLVIFSFSHIGMVEKILPHGRIQTIEGNTDVSGGRTGGKVMRKIRHSGIQGYCHPDYTRVRPTPHPAPHPHPPPRPARATAPARPAAVHLPAQHPVATHQAAAPPKPAGPAHTAVEAHNVLVPANVDTTVQFTEATANTGGFWAPPQGQGPPHRGSDLAVGPGLFIGDVTIQAPQLPEHARLTYRLVQADPAHQFAVSKAHPAAQILGATPTTEHAAVASRLRPAQHLWVQIHCTHPVTVPSVQAEVIWMPGP